MSGGVRVHFRTLQDAPCLRLLANATASALKGRHESASMPYFRPLTWRANLAGSSPRYPRSPRREGAQGARRRGAGDAGAPAIGSENGAIGTATTG